VPPRIGRVPDALRGTPFEVRRGGRPVVAGPFDAIVEAARAGRLDAGDAVRGLGLEAAPAELAELAPFVPGRLERDARRTYLAYLAASALAAVAGVATLAAARATDRLVHPNAALFVLLYAAALAPLPFLRRGWRRYEAGRARGLVPEVLEPPRPTLGSATLDAAAFGPTPATRAVLVVVVAVSVAALLLPPEVLFDRLAKDSAAIHAGEVWRLLTAGLVHGGAFHLFMNAMVLSNVGGMAERLLGARRMLVVLWGGVLAGSLASFFTNPARSVGISGGLFALVGALLAVGLRYRRALPPPARRMLVRAPVEIIVLNVALGLALPIIDNAAHLGGLAGGFLLGLALGLRPAIRAALRPSHAG
jgi:membrane associated rhomboid family serine protease